MTLAPVLNGRLTPGRYQLAGEVSLPEAQAQASAVGWVCVAVDGARMTDPASMFAEFATALSFPSWFGANWDAFSDCLRDLSWSTARGYVVLWQRGSRYAEADPVGYEQAGAIIDEVIASRVAMGLAPLYVLYPGRPEGPVEIATGDAASRLRPIR